MWIMILITLSAYVILAYILPFMKSIRGVENTSGAYYQAYSGIEQALYHTKTRATLTTETGSVMNDESVAYSFQTFSSGTTIPEVWYGNSEYSTGHNIISQTEPIQLEIGNAYITNWTNVNFNFKIPAFTGGALTLSGSDTPIINWMLSSDTDTLYATGSWITATDINSWNWWPINDKNGFILSWSGKTFSDFYAENCNDSGSWCTLKMSVINDLVLYPSGTKIPYLEYQINFWNNNLPDRYTRVEAYGKSYGFQKKLDVRVPQQTVNQAFDFTVFQ